MDMTLLGSTGIRVSRLALGTMTFGSAWGWGADEKESRAIFDLYDEVGGNFIDTADIYTAGESETLLGRLLTGRRDRFVVSTKYGIATSAEDLNSSGSHLKNLHTSIDASLKRLATDYIDLLWVHVWDGVTPIDATLTALERAVSSGKVLHVGLSDHPAWLVARIDAIAEARGAFRLAAIQVEYSLAQREAERELIPMARHLGLSVLDWSPLAGGALTHRDTTNRPHIERADAVAHFAQYRDQRTADIADVVRTIAEQHSATPPQIALAWILHQAPEHIPIIGARTVAHARDNFGALELKLSETELATLQQASSIPLGFPVQFLRDGRSGWFHNLDHRIDKQRTGPDHQLLAE
ncbi:aldo/keto reductase [Microbacterium sp. CCNWLW134]|jgi:aryl-alcohol dehydrogenase-like predicted oxidoreductase|uniref:aldo/keto reductase n=1 Tax=Microbacterium sp. CCNWLW134 TaxID=3122064 RepID=UPI003010396D